jgi:hypothetical protein
VSAEQAMHIQEDALIPMMRMQCSLNQQLMDPQNPIMVRLFVDEQGQMVNPSNGELLSQGIHWAEVGANDIQGEFDFEIIGASQIAQTMQQQQQQMQFINMASQDPQFGMYVDKKKFYKSSMEKMGFTDAWQYIKSDEQVQNEQMAAAQQQQGMGNQGGPPGQAQGAPPSGGGGVPSLPGSAGGGGSPARPPDPRQLAGPSRMV